MEETDKVILTAKIKKQNHYHVVNVQKSEKQFSKNVHLKAFIGEVHLLKPWGKNNLTWHSIGDI